MNMPPEIQALAEKLIARLVAERLTIATAESCTGGLIAGALTSVAGSSDAVYGGFVTYANDAKIDMLGVEQSALESFGAVSEQTARQMSEGARAAAGTDYAIAVTGVAGPGGGSPEKPVGLVWFGLTSNKETVSMHRQFGNIGRAEVREQTVLCALQMVLDQISD